MPDPKQSGTSMSTLVVMVSIKGHYANCVQCLDALLARRMDIQLTEPLKHGKIDVSLGKVVVWWTCRVVCDHRAIPNRLCAHMTT